MREKIFQCCLFACSSHCYRTANDTVSSPLRRLKTVFLSRCRGVESTCWLLSRTFIRNSRLVFIIYKRTVFLPRASSRHAGFYNVVCTSFVLYGRRVFYYKTRQIRPFEFRRLRKRSPAPWVLDATYGRQVTTVSTVQLRSGSSATVATVQLQFGSSAIFRHFSESVTVQHFPYSPPLTVLTVCI